MNTATLPSEKHGYTGNPMAPVQPLDADPETSLRQLWTSQNVPEERQNEILASIDAAAQPGAYVGPFQIPPPEQETPYQREKRENREQSISTARELAFELTISTNETWTTTPDKDEDESYHVPNFSLIRERDTLTISARQSWKDKKAWHVSPDKITVTGKCLSLHDYRPREGDNGSVNISQTKPPARIAADILRRVLPHAETAAQKARDGHAQDLEREAWLKATTSQMMAAYPGLEQYGSDEKYSHKLYSRHTTPRVEIEICTYNRDVKLTIDGLTPDAGAFFLSKLNPTTEGE